MTRYVFFEVDKSRPLSVNNVQALERERELLRSDEW